MEDNPSKSIKPSGTDHGKEYFLLYQYFFILIRSIYIVENIKNVKKIDMINKIVKHRHG